MICRLCRKTGGHFERVTYTNAPEGGVPVHFTCLPAFFEQLERKQWIADVKAATEEGYR